MEAASVRAAVDTTAILPNFSIMTRLPFAYLAVNPHLDCSLPTETSNKAQAGISDRLSRDISRYGESEDRRVRQNTSANGVISGKPRGGAHAGALEARYAAFEDRALRGTWAQEKRPKWIGTKSCSKKRCSKPHSHPTGCQVPSYYRLRPKLYCSARKRGARVFSGLRGCCEA